MAQRRPSVIGAEATRHGVKSVVRLGMPLVALIFCGSLATPCIAQNIDGGRSELPGMKQDIFDQVQRNKGKSQQKAGKGPPDCHRSDGMSPFMSLAFVAGKDLYVRLNSTAGKCERLISVGGANYSMLKNYSLTCGPVGEWKRRIAENISSVFFQGGWEWVKTENDTIEVITEESGSVMVEVNEQKYEVMLDCWKYACDCEQAKSPMMRAVFFTLLAIALGGLGYDSFKVAYAKIFGEKPPKHVECKSGHRMEEVKYADKHYCDLCHTHGTNYACSSNCNYDLCKKCYKTAKKELKAAWEKWCEKHPEDKKEKKKKGEKEESENDEKSKSDAEDKKSERSDTEDKSGTETGKEDSGKETEPESKEEASEEKKDED